MYRKPLELMNRFNTDHNCTLPVISTIKVNTSCFVFYFDIICSCETLSGRDNRDLEYITMEKISGVTYYDAEIMSTNFAG